MKHAHRLLFFIGLAALAAANRLPAQAAHSGDAFVKQADRPVDLDKEKVLYVVGYAHLDTQWRWIYPQVIDEFLANTLHDNFKLFPKYPNYIFNFTGSRRYEMMQEYYPAEFETVKKYVAQGRWFPAGSSVDEGDSLVPSAESLVRQILYGNHYFRREFGIASREYMLPDCFGFPAALPSILAHCGIEGFSTQKLTWGSAVGIPFKVGVWVGPDGRSVVAALDPGAYNNQISEDLSQSADWLARIDHTGKSSGPYLDYHYYGIGDRGGAPSADSVAWIERSVAGKGPIRVVSATTDRMVRDLTPEQKDRLPRYQGELLLVNHSAGAISSEAYMKRWNRKNELLAGAAERASVAASWLGAESYPSERIYRAWDLVLGSQMHDMLPGTSVPMAYQFCWNDECLAQNQLTGVLQEGLGGVADSLDTRGSGVPLVVYNPLSIAREDVVEAEVRFPGEVPAAVRVIGPDDEVVPSQILRSEGGRLTLLILARVPSLGFVDYEVQAASGSPSGPRSDERLSASAKGLENGRYRVAFDAAGDVASIYDKIAERELLSKPMRLAFQYERPVRFPAWNMEWEDQSKPPRGYVEGPAKIRVLEQGPVRVAVEISRDAEDSRFVQTVRLAAGAAGDRVEIASRIDWRSRECALKAVFPLAVSNPEATYDGQIGTLSRGTDNPTHFEVPQQQWFDLTDTDGKYGVAVLNDSKYASDKPDDHTMRLTLIYTPGVRGEDQDQASQDEGRHRMLYAVMGHVGDWSQGGVRWAAARLNQPLIAAQAGPHPGPLGKSFGLLRVDSTQVSVMALKKAEDSDAFIVRLTELENRPARGVRVTFAAPIVSAREVNGQEQDIGPAVLEGGVLVTDVSGSSLRAFAVKLASPAVRGAASESAPVPLPYDFSAATAPGAASGKGFDGNGHSYPAEALPERITGDGVEFNLGSAKGGAPDAVACRGQRITLPSGDSQRLYLLASAAGGDVPADFEVDGKPSRLLVQEWTGFIGQWDTRIWEKPEPTNNSVWNDDLIGLRPGYLKPAEVAWYSSHRHEAAGTNEAYRYSYLFQYSIELPPGARTLELPNDPRIRIFAASLVKVPVGGARLCSPIFETFKDHRLDAPGFSPAPGRFSDTIKLSISHPLYWREGCLHYTLDGSEPTAASPIYSSADGLALVKPTRVKVRYIDGHRAGLTAEGDFEVEDTTPPRITEARTAAGVADVEVLFSEPVDATSGRNPSLYRLSGYGTPVSVSPAADGRSALLAFARPFQAGPGAPPLVLQAGGIADRSPAANRMAAANVPVALAQPVLEIASARCPEQAREAALPPVGDKWSLNFFVRADQPVANRTVIAGFGSLDAGYLNGRYVGKFPEGIQLWSRAFRIGGEHPFELGRWHMLTATYDGFTAKLYQDGVKIDERAEEKLAPDEPVLRIAPLDPWDQMRRFKGEVRDLTFWPETLSESLVAATWNVRKEGR